MLLQKYYAVAELSQKATETGGTGAWSAIRNTAVAAKIAVWLPPNMNGIVVHLLSIDTGFASGASLWRYGDTEPASMIHGWEIPGGYDGFADWLDGAEWAVTRLTVIAEKWIPYPTGGHSPTLDSTYPLVLEGVLIDRGIMPAEYPDPAGRWRRSSLQYWMPGKDAKSKRAAQKRWLKENTDLYRTAGQLGVKHKDAEDYLSSVFHALSWFRSVGHTPTIAHYWGEAAQ